MSIVLPKEIDFIPSLPVLPECISQEVVLAPVNGNTFRDGGQLVQFDLTSRGFIDPTSIYFRYKYKLSNTAAETSVIRGTPVYSFFSKLETIIGSTIYESVSLFNLVCNMMINCQMDIAMKYGLQSAYGWSTQAAPSIEDLDYRQCTNNEENSLAAPLPCLLSNCEKMIPMFLLPNVRIQLTTEAISNIFGTTTPPEHYDLSNVELCYTMIDFSGGVNDIVKSMGDKFYIKSQSFSTIGNTLGALGAGSNVELIYNMRLASIKSLFTSFQNSNSTRCVNGLFDSIDPTSSNGELSYTIASTSYPARPISTKYNKASVLMELKKALGALHSDVYNFSINSIEFGHSETSVATTATTKNTPGKFYFSCNTEKMVSNGQLLSGISTQNSPISLRINTGTATAQPYTIYVTAMYDCLIEIDPINRQAVVKY